jgi:hypothetical protein
MQEVHPDVDLKAALIPVILAWVFLLVSVEFGIWDKFLETAVAWFPYWHWGG